MAKVGLNFGDKIQISDKQYRTLNDGVDLDAVYGDLSFRSIEEQDVIYEDDLSRPRREDGTYHQISTGEVRGVVLGIHSSIQQETLFVTIVDMTLPEIEALGLKYREPVELEGKLLTYSSINGRDNFKHFASKLSKKQNVGVKSQPKQDHKQEG